MVTPSSDQREALQKLEVRAEQLLATTAGSSEPATEDVLRQLESIAASAAKISFGSASPELLSDDMQNLIRWTDHVDDAVWVERFRMALRHRPLASPWTQTI
jgi:hypothetical protein